MLVMGVLSRGRREHWKFLMKAPVFHRRAFPEAMALAIIGCHFRRVATALYCISEALGNRDR